MRQLFIVLAIFSITPALAQDADEKSKKTTTEFRVEGVCNMCKDRIEETALVKGVKFAEWDKTTKMLKVVFRSDKISEEEIHQKLADAGHKTSLKDITKESYESLPDCCRYDHLADH
ncbi:MAG: heavy-metal-associated domain-containing protein [Bacteroidetes bacterium]|nr:heavy-metal-associated domain-containing protein [Bacteroidota bacterium]